MLHQRLVAPTTSAPGHPAVVGFDLTLLVDEDTPILRGTVQLALPADQEAVVIRAIVQHHSGAMETNDASDWLVSAGVQTIDVEWWLDRAESIRDLRFAVGITDKTELVAGQPHPSITVHDVRYFLAPHHHGTRRLDLLGDIDNAGPAIETCNLVVEYLDAQGGVLDDGFAIGDVLPPGRTTLSFLGTWDAEQQAAHGTPHGVRVRHLELERTRWWTSALGFTSEAPPPPPPQPGTAAGQSPAGVELSLGALPNRPDEFEAPVEVDDLDVRMKKLQDR